jgi:hypothetical protein
MKGFICTAYLFYCCTSIGQGYEPDTTLNQIVLEDAKSFIAKFGADTSKIRYYVSYGEALPQLNLINKTGDKKLTLIVHPGNEKWAFSECKVSYTYTREEETEGLIIGDKDFETGKGIKLWTSQADLIKKMGEPTQIKYDQGDPIYKYTFTDKTSKLLRSKNKAAYFATYKLKYGKVVEFHFGFARP